MEDNTLKCNKSETVRSLIDQLAKEHNLNELEKAFFLGFCLLTQEERKPFHPIIEDVMHKHKKKSVENTTENE